LTFPKVLGVVAALVVIGNGLLLAAFLGLEIETQIHALVTRDERNVVSFLHQADKDRAKWSSPPPEIAPPRDHPPQILRRNPKLTAWLMDSEHSDSSQ
jgi:hypothetical protein